MADYNNDLGTQLQSALANWAAQNQAQQQTDYRNKVYAANPAYAQLIFGDQNERDKIAKSVDAPSSVREYAYYNSLTDAQKQDYLRVKRAQQIIDLGGSQAVLNPIAPGIGQNFDKTLAPADQPANAGAKALATSTAANQATAQADLPKTLQNGSLALKTIDDILTAPGTDKNLGIMGMLPNLPGTQASDAKAKMQQLQGQVFLSAYDQLRGAGAITGTEGEKGETAKATLQTTQSPEAYRKALLDLRDVISNGVSIAKQKAEGNFTGSSIQNPPIQAPIQQPQPVVQPPQASIQPQAQPAAQMVRVRKGNEQYQIPITDLPAAQADGFQVF